MDGILPGHPGTRALADTAAQSSVAQDQRVPAIVPWATERTRSRLIMLNDAMLGRDYLLGDRFTTADIMVAGTLFWIPLMLKDFPELLAYSQRLKQREAYVRASAA